MSRSQDLYQAKRTAAAEAVTAVPRTCNLVLGAFSAQPPALMRAVADRVRAGAHDVIRLYYMGSSPAMGETLLQYDLMPVVKPHPAFIWPLERALEAEGRRHQTQTIFYVPASFSSVPKLFSEYIHPDVVLLQVSPMDRAGYFSLGTINAYSLASARACDHLLVEVNERMPRTFGEAFLHVSEVHAIVEHTSALPEVLTPPAGEIERQIGHAILELVPERACVQFGIGSIPNAVAAMLKDHRDLGVSIITGHATADQGQASRIVPRLEGPITDPRMDTQYIVTEYGVCDLRGKSTRERALGLIEIAHPDYRQELLTQAKELGYLT